MLSSGGKFTEAAKRRGKYIPPLATNTEVNNCFSIYENSEITEHKNDDFLTHLLLPTITILARNDRTATVVAFSC